jgi:hypothetical protein
VRANADDNNAGAQSSDASTKASPRTVLPQADHGAWMMTSLLLWLCTLPIVGLLVFPRLGPRATLIVVIALLAIFAVVCYGVCAWQTIGSRRGAGNE